MSLLAPRREAGGDNLEGGSASGPPGGRTRNRGLRVPRVTSYANGPKGQFSQAGTSAL